jgi:hypothetical protein
MKPRQPDPGKRACRKVPIPADYLEDEASAQFLIFRPLLVEGAFCVGEDDLL